VVGKWVEGYQGRGSTGYLEVGALYRSYDMDVPPPLMGLYDAVSGESGNVTCIGLVGGVGTCAPIVGVGGTMKAG
jgi:hypothetical protein